MPQYATQNYAIPKIKKILADIEYIKQKEYFDKNFKNTQ